MSIIAAGTPAPDFSLARADGERFTQEDLKGRTTVLVFYPFAFSGVCTNQLQAYEEELDELRAKGVEMFGVSTDPSPSQQAFKDSLGVSIEQLSDFEPKGEVAKAFGAFFAPGGMTNRALVVTGPDGVVRWSHLAENPGVLPGFDLVLEGVAAVPAS